MKANKHQYKKVLIAFKDAVDDAGGKQVLLTTYETGQFHNAAKVMDLNKRLRWDMFWFSNIYREFVGSYFNQLNDEHIDTMLRAVMAEINLKAVKRY